VNEEIAKINIESRLVNATGKKLKILHELYNEDGIRIQQSTAGSSRKDQDTNIRSMEISNPLRWYADHPVKYTMVSSLLDNKGTVLDRIKNNFGIRTLDVDSDQDNQITIRLVPEAGTPVLSGIKIVQR